MSNHSHLHKNEQGQEVDAFGTREECDVCRQRAGLPSMADVRTELASRGVDISQLTGGSAPSEQLLADLEEAEATIDALRAQVKAGNPELARERDEAVAENGQLKRAMHGYEQRFPQLEAEAAKVPELERELQKAREQVASLEQSLAAKKK